MVIKDLILSSTKKCTLILFSVLLLGIANVAAQSDLRNQVYGKPNGSNKPKSSNSTQNKNKTPKASTPKPAPVVSKTTTQRQGQKKSASKLVPVTFNGKEAMVEIWLNDKNIGVTDSNLQFSKKIAPGEYRLMAKNKRQVLVSQKITISAEQTQFDLFEKKPPVLQVVKATEDMSLPKPKTQAEIDKENSEKVKVILQAYVAPSTTDFIKTEDWQFVLQNVQLGVYQGFTAVQIEAQRWLASGQIEFSKKDYANAFTAYYKASENMPTWAFPYYELGNTYLAKNQLADAIKVYQRALQLDNKLGMVYKKLGDAQRLSGKEKEALSAYELAIQFGYKTFETRYQLASLRLEGKQIEQGIADLEDLVKENPSAELYLKLGESYEKLKRPLTAIENYQKAISLDPNATQAHYRIGGMFMIQREYTKAKESLEKAIALDPSGKILDIKEAQKKLREIATKSNR